MWQIIDPNQEADDLLILMTLGPQRNIIEATHLLPSMKSAVLISLLLPLALASPLSKDATATKGQPYAGSSTADVYPPTGGESNLRNK